MNTESYYLIDDMEKYNPLLDKDMYEEMEKDHIISEFRDYYKSHLPVDLLTWSRVNDPDDNLIYKKGFWDQVMLIRDTINMMLNGSYEEYQANPVMVINTHTSKSVTLPVYFINLKKYGVKMILRNNFYDWKVSVISDKELSMDFKGVFAEEDEPIHAVYCEGFKSDQVFGRFVDNKKRFTISIGGQYNLYTFMFLLVDYLKSE
jgi:hypothetical protein